MMREKMERLVILPFSIGCVSESSVAVQQPRRSSNNHLIIKPNHSPITRIIPQDEEEESMKNSLRFLAPSKPNISSGIHRLFKGFKSFSQFFVNKDEDMEGKESDLDIGFPTDVKHVTHIGWDLSPTNCNSNNDNMNTENGIINPELLSLAPFSFTQFERKHTLLPPPQTENNNAPLVA